MMEILERANRLVLIGVVVGYVVKCPYSKVEESFNTQAVHDAWIFGVSGLEEWDHLEFAGTVPRTFSCALLIGYVCRLLEGVFTTFGFGATISGMNRQVVARTVLCLFFFLGFERCVHGLQNQFGKRCGTWLRLFTAAQFHIPFYASRFLPNSLALSPLLYAYGLAFDGHRIHALAITAATTAILRCDILTLFLPMALVWTLSDFRLMRQGIFACTRAVFFMLLLTVPIDSLLWQYPVWPEATVFVYNNPVENKSADWGTSPPLWYWTSALQRALNPSIFLLALLAAFLYEPKRLGLYFISPAIISILLLSILPHKELRFIFPALPLLTAAAAVSADRLLRHTSFLLRLIPYIALGLTALPTAVLFYPAAQRNYPGGQALFQTHFLFRNNTTPKILHIDVAAATTGASRFGQAYSHWTYDKTENIIDPSTYDSFDLRIAPLEPRDPADHQSRQKFTVLDTIAGYGGVHLNLPSRKAPLPILRSILSLLLGSGFDESDSLLQHRTKPELLILAAAASASASS